MTRVVVTGSAGAVGRRVVRALAVLADPPEILAVDRAGQSSPHPAVETKRIDLASADLAAVFAGADTVVHLASPSTPGHPEPAAEALDVAITRRVLDAAEVAGVGHLVVLSSAMVYGAWAANPVPITEGAPMRPNPDFSWAVVRAEIETLASEWGARRPERVVTILRPTAVVTDDNLGRLARVLRDARTGVAAEGDPPVQYLHLDDLVSAIVVVVTAPADGAFNVAPDGWIPPDALHDLEGPVPRVRVPAWVARAIAAVRWRWGVAPVPPGIVPYTSHSWVVANDRLRSLGWTPEFTNEEAWVVSHQPGPLDRLPARRRQELALGAAVVLLAGVVVGVGVLVRRLRRSAGDVGM